MPLQLEIWENAAFSKEQRKKERKNRQTKKNIRQKPSVKQLLGIISGEKKLNIFCGNFQGIFKPENVAIHVAQNTMNFVSSSIAWWIAGTIAASVSDFNDKRRSFEDSAPTWYQVKTNALTHIFRVK